MNIDKSVSFSLGTIILVSDIKSINLFSYNCLYSKFYSTSFNWGFSSKLNYKSLTKSNKNYLRSSLVK